MRLRRNRDDRAETTASRSGLDVFRRPAVRLILEGHGNCLSPYRAFPPRTRAALRTAHSLGLRTTATIMYGHIEHPLSWARHRLKCKLIGDETEKWGKVIRGANIKPAHHWPIVRNRIA